MDIWAMILLHLLLSKKFKHYCCDAVLALLPGRKSSKLQMPKEQVMMVTQFWINNA